MTYRESFRQLAEILKSKGEDDLIENLEQVIRLSGEYVYKVCNMEGAFVTANLTMDSKDCREYLSRLDSDRHNTHERLIPAVKLLNKICRMIELEPIYKGDINNRVEIGNFAVDVASELFESRKI